jgi:hypothetical protein
MADEFCDVLWMSETFEPFTPFELFEPFEPLV